VFHSDQRHNERFERGRRRLREATGRDADDLTEALGDLGRYVVEFVFGDVYTRPGLSLRDRELITVAMLTALGGREDQLDVHLRAATNVGIPLAELRELMVQVAPYAGFPAAINGLQRLRSLEARSADDM